MGMFEVDVRVANPGQKTFHKRKMLVDTGASYSALPASFLTEELGIEPVGQETIFMADSTSHDYPIGEARFKVDGIERTAPVIFGAEDMYILGTTALESMGLIPDVNGNRLVKCAGFLVSIRGEPYRR